MSNITNIIRQNLSEGQRILQEFMADPSNIDAIEKSVMAMSKALLSGNKIISCGNGGSMSDAMHFAEELTGRFRNNRIALPALAISDPSFLTCAANDFGYENIFSRFIEGVGKEGDVLLAISTSGNSANIINAVAAAKNKKMTCLALTGKKGGKLAPLCDVAVIAPESEWADRVQEIHIKVIHCFIDCIEQNLNLS